MNSINGEKPPKKSNVSAKEYEELKAKYEKLIQIHNEVLSVLQQFGLNIQIVASQNKIN